MIFLLLYNDVFLGKLVRLELLRDLVKRNVDSFTQMAEFEQRFIKALEVMAQKVGLYV